MRIRYDRHATIIDAWNNPALAAICFRILNNTAESIDTNSVICQPLQRLSVCDHRSALESLRLAAPDQ